MLSLERLTTPPPHSLPPPQKKRKKVLDHYLHNLGMPPLLWCFFFSFTHLRIRRSPPNLISSSLYYPGPLHKISSQSVHNFLRVMLSTDRQRDKQTNTTKNITSFAKEVINKCWKNKLSEIFTSFCQSSNTQTDGHWQSHYCSWCGWWKYMNCFVFCLNLDLWL